MAHSTRAPELGDELVAVLLDSLGAGAARCHGDRIVFANAALASLLGANDASKLADASLASFFAGAGGAPPELAGERPVECRLLRADGLLRAALVRRFDGLPGEDSLWVVRDVTELREREAELARAEAALALAEAERAALAGRLEREVTERETLLTELSHELRTPVTVIAGYARLLLSENVGPLNAVQRRFLEQSARSCQRLVDLIGRLLEAAAHAQGQVELEWVEAPLAPTIESVARLLAPLLEQKRLALEVALSPAADRARFDPLRVEQVLSNLLGNAIRHAPGGSAIRIVSAPAPGGFVEVAVCDAGPGVAPEDRERIFQPYVRGGQRRGAGGLGLGLAIVKRLVEAHGGAIRVREAPGGGSVFAFTLPAADPARPRGGERG